MKKSTSQVRAKEDHAKKPIIKKRRLLETGANESSRKVGRASPLQAQKRSVASTLDRNRLSQMVTAVFMKNEDYRESLVKCMKVNPDEYKKLSTEEAQLVKEMQDLARKKVESACLEAHNKKLNCLIVKRNAVQLEKLTLLRSPSGSLSWENIRKEIFSKVIASFQEGFNHANDKILDSHLGLGGGECVEHLVNLPVEIFTAELGRARVTKQSAQNTSTPLISQRGKCTSDCLNTMLASHVEGSLCRSTSLFLAQAPQDQATTFIPQLSSCLPHTSQNQVGVLGFMPGPHKALPLPQMGLTQGGVPTPMFLGAGLPYQADLPGVMSKLHLKFSDPRVNMAQTKVLGSMPPESASSVSSVRVANTKHTARKSSKQSAVSSHSIFSASGASANRKKISSIKHHSPNVSS